MDEKEANALLDRLAGTVPVGPAPVDRLVHDGTRTLRRRRALISAAAAVALLGGVGVPTYLATRTPVLHPYAVGQDPTADRTGELPTGAMASCVEQYTPDAVDRRGFAFDGVVVDIGDPVGGHDLPYAGVTFAVEEWFAGGSGATVTVDMPPPLEGGGSTTSLGGPSYAVGSRLLVSGEPQPGGADLMAWSCGFTRYHDPQTAAAWR